MMRSDMPRQIMAYRNGGGLPSLATAPMGYSNGGGISSYISNAYNTAVNTVTNALGMNDDNSYAPELTTQPGPESNPMSAQEKFDSNPARQASVSRKKRKKKKARQAAAREAAAAAAEAATVNEGIGSLDTNVGANNSDVMNAYITNVLERDDLSAVEKLEFAQSLADTYGVAGGTGIQSVADNLSNVALDPTSSLSDSERVNALTSLGTYSGTDYSGLINTLNNQIANNNLANINNIATTTPGADVLLSGTGITTNVATTPAINTVQNNTAMVPAAPATYTGYAPIVPASNINTAGIAGLPSTNTAAINPYTFTAYTPGTFNSTVNPLVLPPLG
jgi:hypothetical protein